MTESGQIFPSSDKKKHQVKTWLIVIEALMALSFLPWLLFAGIGIMAFDSGYSIFAAIFAGTLWSYPLLAIIFSTLAWIFYRKNKYTLAAVSPLISFLPLLVVGLIIVFAG